MDRRMVPLLRPGSVVLVDTAYVELTDRLLVTTTKPPAVYFVDVPSATDGGWFRERSLLGDAAAHHFRDACRNLGSSRKKRKWSVK